VFIFLLIVSAVHDQMQKFGSEKSSTAKVANHDPATTKNVIL